MSANKALNPDSKAMVIIATAMLGVMAVVAFILSFASLSALADWASLPWFLAWGIPIIIDVAISAFTIAILIFRARDESTAAAWTLLLAFTLLSAAGNAAHALGEGDFSDWRTYVGASVAALAPIAQFVTTHTVARLVVAKPSKEVAEVVVEAKAKAETAREERNQRIVAMRADGMTLKGIAEAMSMSEGNVHRILKKHREDQVEQPSLELVGA